MKTGKVILIGLAVVFTAIQFFPADLPTTVKENPADLIGSGIVEPKVASLLLTACYDCHSNTTHYPWYAKVAPVSWLVAKDVREGREELNFSEWADLEMMDQLGLLDDIYTEVEGGRMPLPIYIPLHPGAKLDTAQRKAIMDWTEAAMDVIAESEDF